MCSSATKCASGWYETEPYEEAGRRVGSGLRREPAGGRGEAAASVTKEWTIPMLLSAVPLVRCRGQVLAPLHDADPS